MPENAKLRFEIFLGAFEVQVFAAVFFGLKYAAVSFLPPTA
jgi:hypothetical protein